MYFWQIQKFAYGEINERSFSNPHPRYVIVGIAAIEKQPEHDGVTYASATVHNGNKQQ